MQLDHIAGAAFEHLFGRLLRRALLLCVLALLALIAIYHFTVAGTLALEAQYGMLYARLIIAGIYAALAFIAVIVWWATRAKAAKAGTPALAAPREMQIAMLVEAVMLGYSLAARKGERAR